jgi:glycosyltransferase involved in cell wall biosynthesis
MRNKKKLLLIGPLPIEGDVIGGAKVLFFELVKRFKNESVFDIYIINTSRQLRGKGHFRKALVNFKAFFLVFKEINRKIPASDIVMLNVSPYASAFVGPLLWIICKIKKKKFAIRFFGGDFDEFYTGTFFLNRWIAKKTYLQCPLVVMETKRLCDKFREFKGIQWYPNTRDVQINLKKKNRNVKKLVFISQLRTDKGYIEAMEAVKRLPPEFQLDIYGSPMPDTDMKIFDNYKRCKYRGVLKPAEVPSVIAQSDLLLLPTYYYGEGYPGIILESLQCGTPVITTYWKDIPEIIQDGVNGLLVHPRSIKEIVTSVMKLKADNELFKKIAEGALERGDFFRTGRWHQTLKNKLLELVN